MTESTPVDPGSTRKPKVPKTVEFQCATHMGWTESLLSVPENFLQCEDSCVWPDSLRSPHMSSLLKWVSPRAPPKSANDIITLRRKSSHQWHIDSIQTKCVRVNGEYKYIVKANWLVPLQWFCAVQRCHIHVVPDLLCDIRPTFLIYINLKNGKFETDLFALSCFICRSNIWNWHRR